MLKSILVSAIFITTTTTGAFTQVPDRPELDFSLLIHAALAPSSILLTVQNPIPSSLNQMIQIMHTQSSQALTPLNLILVI